MTVRIAMSRCSACGVLRAVVGEHRCPREIRDVNRDGLGDRRGVAIEKVTKARYRPGTLQPIAPRVFWQVYEDGAVRFRSDREGEAREVAHLMVEKR